MSGRKIVCRPRLVETILRLPTIPRHSIPRPCRPRRRGNYSANFQPNRSSTGGCGACSCIEMHYRPKLNVKYVPRAQRGEKERKRESFENTAEEKNQASLFSTRNRNKIWSRHSRILTNLAGRNCASLPFCFDDCPLRRFSFLDYSDHAIREKDTEIFSTSCF